MKKFWLFYAAMVGLCLTAGCQHEYWYQEGKTFDECRAEQADCRAELVQRADLNYVGDYEHRFMMDCMRQKGYRLLTQKELPLDARREEPNVASGVPINWAYGVAGGIGE
jgi:hypothetical protein